MGLIVYSIMAKKGIKLMYSNNSIGEWGAQEKLQFSKNSSKFCSKYFPIKLNVVSGMLRSEKDLVLEESGVYICFSCWNKIIREKGDSDE